MNRVQAFVVVGVIGFVLQIATLVLLSSGLHWRFGPATAAAVEIAILNNFWWHERWTWRDRSQAGRLTRLCRFQIGAGGLSLAGNLAGAVFLVQHVHVGVVAANVVSVSLISLANFLVADRWVFAPAGRVRRERSGSAVMSGLKFTGQRCRCRSAGL